MFGEDETQLLDRIGVETDRRFVQHEKLGPVRQRLGQKQLPSHPE